MAGVDVGDYSIPTVADINGDTLADAFIRERRGYVSFFEGQAGSPWPDLIERTGAANPLDAVGVPPASGTRPAFVDIDDDGDLDAFVGHSEGFERRDSVRFFENQGDDQNPDFVERPGAANRLSAVGAVYPQYAYDTAPAFVDIDGDYDAFVGHADFYCLDYFFYTKCRTTPYDSVQYFENLDVDQITPYGYAKFVERAGAGYNPLHALSAKYTTPALLDIDAAGDYDAFIGEEGGTIFYLENQGDANVPSFVEQLGAANPLDGIDLGWHSSPAFVDIDGDGDYDAFLGHG